VSAVVLEGLLDFSLEPFYVSNKVFRKLLGTPEND
jgi:hypothetical protein